MSLIRKTSGLSTVTTRGSPVGAEIPGMITAVAAGDDMAMDMPRADNTLQRLPPKSNVNRSIGRHAPKTAFRPMARSVQ